MKKSISSYLSVILVTVMVMALSVSALAAAGVLTIEVYPIRVLVNGKEFQPKDTKGKDAMVFTYNGTTYAPLRALAEAYGLEVGYDAVQRMATVSDPAYVSQASRKTAEYISVNLVKMNDKYYQMDTSNWGMTYYYMDNGEESLLFAHDILINAHGHPASWYLNYILRLALLKHYTVDPVDNPYVDGLLKITEPDLFMEGYFAAGSDDIVYLSPTESYTPVWYQYNGKKVYAKTTRTNGLFVGENNIRYYDGYVCVNDLLDYWGISAQVNVGKLQDSWYIEALPK